MRTSRTGATFLTVEDLGENDALMLTIDGGSVRNFARNYLAQDERKVVLTFKETGDAEYVLNATGYARLAARYGYLNVDRPDFNGWLGKACVLVAQETDNPQQPGSRVRSLWVASPAQWAEATRDAPPVTPRSRQRLRGKRGEGK